MWRIYPVSHRHPNPRKLNSMPQRRITFWMQRKYSMTEYSLRGIYGASILAWRKYGSETQQVWLCLRIVGKLHFFKVPRALLHLAKPFNKYIPGA